MSSALFSLTLATRAARRGYAALAFVALSLVVVAPVCSAFEDAARIVSLPGAVLASSAEPASHSGDAGACCASADGACIPVVESPVSDPAYKSPAPALPAAFLPPEVTAIARRSPAIPPPEPSRVLPYHVRSARSLV